VKKGWQEKSVGDILQLEYGKPLDESDRKPNGRYPVYGANGEKDRTDKFYHDKPSIIVGRKGSAGEVNLTEKKFWPLDVTYFVTFDEKQHDLQFLYYLLTTLELTKLAKGVKPGINRNEVYSQTTRVPPLAEQQRIVGLLDEAFEGLATAKANAEKNLQNARALFESHLQSVFTQCGPGWVEKSVGELVADGVLVKPFDGNHGEIHPKKSDYTESGVPFIMARDLQDGLVDTEHCIFISRELADSLRVGFAKDGDVLISHKGTIGRSAIVSTEDDYIMLTPQVTGYRVKDSSKLFNRFIRYYFMSPGFRREMIAGAADGSTRAYIGITKQLTLRFRFPPLAEQKRIAAKLDALDPETQRLARLYERKHAALEALKKSLLHQAFTGEL
jgi:type I restriction enzyme S subunit